MLCVNLSVDNYTPLYSQKFWVGTNKMSGCVPNRPFCWGVLNSVTAADHQTYFTVKKIFIHDDHRLAQWDQLDRFWHLVKNKAERSCSNMTWRFKSVSGHIQSKGGVKNMKWQQYPKLSPLLLYYVLWLYTKVTVALISSLFIKWTHLQWNCRGE